MGGWLPWKADLGCMFLYLFGWVKSSLLEALRTLLQNCSTFILPLNLLRRDLYKHTSSEGDGECLGVEWVGLEGVEGGQIDTSQTKRLLLSKVLCLDLDSLKPVDSLMPDPLGLPRDTVALIRFFSFLLCSV